MFTHRAVITYWALTGVLVAATIVLGYVAGTYVDELAGQPAGLNEPNPWVANSVWLAAAASVLMGVWAFIASVAMALRTWRQDQSASSRVGN